MSTPLPEGWSGRGEVVTESNAVLVSFDDSGPQPDPTPFPPTLQYLRLMVAARMRYGMTPLPDGYQLPEGVTLADVLPPDAGGPPRE